MRTRRGLRLSSLVLASVLSVAAILTTSVTANAQAVKEARVTANPKCGKGTNLVKDGSFESAPSGGLFTPLNNPTALPYWTIGANSINITGSSDWVAENGSLSIDLSGNAPGSISQHITDTSGARYDLCFYLGGNLDHGPTVKKMSVRWGPTGATTIATYTFNTSGSTRTHMGWVLEIHGLTGDGSDKLVLKNATASPYNTAFGAAVDNVSIERSA